MSECARPPRSCAFVYLIQHDNERHDIMLRVDITDDAKTWATNSRRFETFEEADGYAHDLAMRWTAVKLARIVPEETPDRERVEVNDERIVVNYL